MKKQTAILLLFLVTVIWGGGFIAIKIALDFGVTVGLINMLRGAMFTLLVLVFWGKELRNMKLSDFKIGFLAGAANMLGFVFQSAGAQYTTLSNSSFLTAVYVLLVPFLAWAIIGKKPRTKNYIAVIICTMGTAVLAGVLQSGFSFNIGDIYTLIGAVAFALSLVFFAMQKTELHFAAGSFMVGLTHFLGGVFYFFVLEGGYIPPAIDWEIAILPILYLGVLSSFLAQTLQVSAQRYVNPSTAGLVLMLESVFGSIFSILFGFEKFTFNLLLGGSLIVASLLVSELEIKKKR